MSEHRVHLVQLNIARMRAPLDDPLMKEFVDRLEPLNAIADEAPGFVWRLQGEEGNAIAIRAFEDDRLLINMSVWTSIESLRDYVYRGVHTEPLKRRQEWFETMDGPTSVLWWVPAGHVPTAAEARETLDRLRRNGPTATAFTFKDSFAPPETTLTAHPIGLVGCQ